MTRLFWIAAWAAVALWSLVAWGAYGLLDLFGYLGSASARDVEGLAWIVRGLQGLGQTAVLVVWLLVSLAILSVPWLLSRITGAPTRHGFQPSRRPGVIDLAPDQYAVRPDGREPGRAEPFSRLPPTARPGGSNTRPANPEA